MCNFSISFAGNADVLIGKAKTTIANASGNFNGDTSGGTFTIPTPIGKIAGSYTVTGQSFNVKIAEKPFFLSCNQIETQLAKYLAA